MSVDTAVFALHVEDFLLKSANIVHMGAPKLWVIVHPMFLHKLEARLAERLQIQPKCDQFLRHHPILPAPSLLRQWRIKYSVVLQPAGSLILIESGAYHYGLNLGANVAEAINYCDEDWIVPPTYRECSRRHGCGNTEHMTIANMQVGKIRALEVANEDEIEAEQSGHRRLIKSTPPRSRNMRPQISSAAKNNNPVAARSLRPQRSSTVKDNNSVAVRSKKSSRMMSAQMKALALRSARQTMATSDMSTPANKSATETELEPSYSSDDLVGQISWWIWFIENHDGDSGLHSLLGEVDDAAEIREHLESLIPDRDSMENSRLSGRVVVGLLEYLFESEETAQVVDPNLLADAFKKEDGTILDLNYDDLTKIIIPHHQMGHWCLIIVNIDDKRLDIYDTDRQVTESVIHFIQSCIPGSDEWTSTFKPVSYTNNSPDRSTQD